jgi:hypothetical protein
MLRAQVDLDNATVVRARDDDSLIAGLVQVEEDSAKANAGAALEQMRIYLAHGRHPVAPWSNRALDGATVTVRDFPLRLR